jgi:hypothetical protein
VSFDDERRVVSVYRGTDVDYMDSPTALQLADASQRMIVGFARRTGITPPGYPCRAVYVIRLKPCDSWGSTHYVYDTGELMEWDAWLNNLQEVPA